MSVEKNSIYLRILEIANVKNSSQLADKLGITPQAVSKWKKDGGIKIETLVSIAEVTGASIHWLLTGQGEKFFTKQEHSGNKKRVNLDDLLPVHGHLFSALSVVAEIGQALKLTAQKETVMVPTSIISEISVVLRVTDDYFAAEGIQAGQLLVVEPVNGSDVTGSVVVAIFNNKPIIRRFERSGNLACFHSLGSLPSFEIPIDRVQILYEVKSITTPIKNGSQ